MASWWTSPMKMTMSSIQDHTKEVILNRETGSAIIDCPAIVNIEQTIIRECSVSISQCNTSLCPQLLTVQPFIQLQRRWFRASDLSILIGQMVIMGYRSFYPKRAGITFMRCSVKTCGSGEGLKGCRKIRRCGLLSGWFHDPEIGSSSGACLW